MRRRRSRCCSALPRTSDWWSVCSGRGNCSWLLTFLDLEVVQVLRRFAASGELSEQRAGEALEDWSMLRITRYPHETFLRRVWQLRHNLTA